MNRASQEGWLAPAFRGRGQATLPDLLYFNLLYFIDSYFY